MDLFDVNCFIGRWTTESHACPDIAGLRREMDRLGIGRTLVRHTWGWWYDPKVGNDALCAALAGREDMIPCLAATPLLDQDLGGLGAFMDQVEQSGAGAVCLYPRSQNFSLSPWSAVPLMEALATRSLPVLLEADQITWEGLHPVLCNFPRVNFIVTRTGYRILRYVLPLLRACPNLHLDIAYFADNQAVEAVASAVGPERLLFGTGTPRVDGAGAVSRLAYSTIAEADRKLIASGNLERLIGGIRVESQTAKGQVRP